MKKLFIILTTIAVLAGCSKTEDNMLLNTTWQTDDYSTINMLFGYSYHVYEFYSEDKASSYWLDKRGNVADSDGDVKYELQYPQLIITKADGSQLEFTFSDRMTFAIGGNSSIVYHRK